MATTGCSRLRLTAAAFLAMGLGLFPGVVHAQSASPCVHIGQDVPVAADDRLRCDVVVLGGDVQVAERGAVLGNVFVLGGDLRAAADSTFAGQVVVLGGTADVGGQVEGSVLATGPITIASTAVVGGEVLGRGQVSVAPGAEVAGEVRRLKLFSADGPTAPSSPGERSAVGLAGLVLALLFLTLVVALAPAAVGHVREAVAARPWSTLLFGVGLAFLVPLLFVALSITVIGPVILVAATVLACAVGVAGVIEATGRGLLRRGQRLLHVLVGGLVWGLPLAGGLVVGSRAVWLAGLVGLLLVLWALGAGTVTLVGRRAWPADVVARPATPDRPATIGVAGTAGFEPSVGTTATTRPAAQGPQPPTVEPAGVSTELTTSPPSRPPEVVVAELAASPSLPAPAAAPGPPLTAAELGLAASSPANDADLAGRPPAAADIPGVVENADRPSGGPTGGEPVVVPGSPLVPGSAYGLRDIAGVTPVYAELLRQAGYASVQAIAEAEPSMLAAAVSLTGLQPVSLAVAQEWVRRAQQLLAGPSSAAPE